MPKTTVFRLSVPGGKYLNQNIKADETNNKTREENLSGKIIPNRFQY